LPHAAQSRGALLDRGNEKNWPHKAQRRQERVFRVPVISEFMTPLLRQRLPASIGHRSSRSSDDCPSEPPTSRIAARHNPVMFDPFWMRSHGEW